MGLVDCDIDGYDSSNSRSRNPCKGKRGYPNQWLRCMLLIDSSRHSRKTSSRQSAYPNHRELWVLECSQECENRVFFMLKEVISFFFFGLSELFVYIFFVYAKMKQSFLNHSFPYNKVLFCSSWIDKSINRKSYNRQKKDVIDNKLQYDVFIYWRYILKNG